MKILVIDPLTQTWDGEIVRSGLQKSAYLDVKALSQEHEVSFAFCGKLEIPNCEFNKIVLSELGAKDLCIRDGINPKFSSNYIKDLFKILKPQLKDYDYIILHVHSMTAIRELCGSVIDKNILIIIHDIIDLFWYKAISSLINEIKLIGNNNVKVYTNSDFNIRNARYLFSRDKSYSDTDKIAYNPDLIFDGYIKHFVWTDIKPEILLRKDFSCVIGRFEKTKYHTKLIGYKNPNHNIIHYGVLDSIRDKDNKIYNTLLKSRNIVKLGLSNDELNNEIKHAHNIVITSWREGFGYTAFEAGIHGVIPIVLIRNISGVGRIHATDEYLTRSNVFHYNVEFTNKKQLFDTINQSLDISDDIRINNSNNLLSYFSKENYINERINILTNGN